MGYEKINALVSSMTLDEKLTLMHGCLADPYAANQAGHVNGIPRLGIPDVFLADGESGVDVLWDATALPAKVALAATFDTAAAERYGEVLGQEARAAGMHIILSSRVNIARDPVAQIGQSNGGNFQTLSEDPLLNGLMGCAEVRGIEKDLAAIANLKHFFGTSTGTAQGAQNSVIDEQTMHDIYLWPFEMVIRAGVGSMMTSYNQVNGTWTYRITDILDKVARARWGFDGIVVNDWCCLYAPEAVKGGVSLEMPEDVAYGARLKAAIEDPTNDVTIEDVDRCVMTYLSTLKRFGMLDAPRVPRPIDEATKLRHIPIARKIAAQSAVLLKNEGVLPLNPEATRIALIGPGASSVAMPVFKEAAYGFADRKQSPLTAIGELTGQDIPFAQGTDMQGEVIPASAWTDLTYYRTRYASDPMDERDLIDLPKPIDGALHTATNIDFHAQTALAPILKPDEYYLFHGNITASETGWHRLSLQTKIPTAEAHARNGITSADMFCFTSGNLYIREDARYRCIGIGTRTAMNGGAVPNSDVVTTGDGWNNAAGFIWLQKGQVYELAATATNLYHDPVEVRLCWSIPSRRARLREEAAALAGSVDVPVVFVWHKSPTPSLNLQEEQEELIAAVAAANPRTVVVLNSGDPVAMPWANDVAAILEMWYPGQEGGYATADVLLGRADPGGRLPVTFPHRLEDTAPHAPGHPERWAPSGKVPSDAAAPEPSATFTEGVHVGYRWLLKEDIVPLFPFGHGLSYTAFDMRLDSVTNEDDGGILLALTVTNTGARSGVFVAQCYIDAPDTCPEGVQFAKRALATFASVSLAAGEARTVKLSVAPERFTYWDVILHERRRLHARRTLRVGTSLYDLPIEFVAHIN